MTAGAADAPLPSPRYGAQAGRVFVFMRKQPVNDTLDLGSLDLKAVQLYLDPAAAEWGQGLVPEDDGTLKPSFSAPSERSFDRCGGRPGSMEGGRMGLPGR